MESSYNRRRRDYKNTNDDDEWASKDTGILLLLLLRLFLGGLLLCYTHPAQTHHDTKYSASAHTFHSIRPVSSFS
jgi:hypothetical protein